MTPTRKPPRSIKYWWDGLQLRYISSWLVPKNAKIVTYKLVPAKPKAAKKGKGTR